MSTRYPDVVNQVVVGMERRARMVLAAAVIAVAALVPAGPARAAGVTACAVGYELRSEWAGGFLSKIVIQNRGVTVVTNWTLVYTYPGDQRLGTAIPANLTQPPGSRQVTLTPTATVATIAPGGEVVLPILIGQFTTDNTFPTGFTLDGVACTMLPPKLVVPRTAISLREGNTTTIPVTLSSPPTIDTLVTVQANGDPDLTFDDGTTRKQFTFTPTNWRTPVNLSIRARQDSDYTANSAFFTIFTNQAGTPPISVTVTEFEDDDPAAPAIVLTPDGPLTVREGSAVTLWVRLDRRPTTPVQVTTSATSGDPDIRVIGGGSLTLNADNWATNHRITIVAVEDADATNGTTTISAGAPGGTPTIELRYTELDNDR